MTDASEAARQRARALARWEGEGGALARADEAGDALDEMEVRILGRLGAALLASWNDIPTELQRAIFTRASTPHAAGDRARLKAEIARFLHDHKDDRAK